MFRYLGRSQERIYSHCIVSSNSKSWCATSVDEDGYMSKWGFCNNNCTEGAFFPFNCKLIEDVVQIFR